jgi:hypothetical protein
MAIAGYLADTTMALFATCIMGAKNTKSVKRGKVL